MQLIPGVHTGKHPATELHDALDDFIKWLPHQDFFPIEKRNDGIRALFDKLDEVRVDGNGRVVQPSQMDHGTPVRGKGSPVTAIGDQGSDVDPAVTSGITEV